MAARSMSDGGDAPAPRRDGPLARYWRDSRDLSTGFLFALPLLLAYELGIVFTDSDVVNGASALMRVLIGTIAPDGWGLAAFNGCVVVAVFWAVVRTHERGKQVWRPGVYTAMAAESLVYSVALLVLMGWIPTLFRPAMWLEGAPHPLGDALGHGVVLSLGAGVYEEIFFRLFLLSGFAWLLTSGFGAEKKSAVTAALIFSALVFSAFHHLGALGDAWHPLVFFVRVVAGVFLGELYLRRGLGIAIWAHALYDIFIVIIQHAVRAG